MPARTLSPFVATDRALLSPPTRHSSYHTSARSHRDAHDYRGTYVGLHRDLHYHSILYDTAAVSTDGSLVYNPFATADYRPANSRFAPPTEHPNVSPELTPSLQMQPSVAPPPPGWLPHPPSQSRPPSLVPPPLLHKVWILDCKSCGTFFTNRGMKAVLLLRPNVPLYSTDALPINCSPHYTMMDQSSAVKAEPSEQSPTTRPTSSFSDTSLSNQSGRVLQPVSRTCECLTQTLYCHGCGRGVGYMIVIPCHRCTSSMTVTNRMTNGHRFVFYSCEIVPSDRHFVSGEPGVMEINVPPIPSPLPQPMPSMLLPLEALSHPTVPSTPRRATRSPLRGRRSAHVRTPSSPRSRRSTISSESDSSPPPLMPLSPHAHSPRASDSAAEPQHDTASPPQYARIKPGDVLYWHNLVRSGEIPAVKEDARARRTADGCGSALKEDAVDRASDTDVPPPRRKVIAGR